MQRVALATVLALLLAARADAEDLSRIYKATLDYEEGAPAREWTCEDADVWHLDSFRYSFEGLELELGPSDVVFGKCGTNVVWAAVLPEQPAKLKAPQQGDGERVSSLFLRFNPALVGKLFPARTVKGHGPPSARLWGVRIFHGKINAAWQAGNQPVIPWEQSIVFDAETVEGRRRMFMADTKKREVKYEDYFASRALPPVVPADAETGRAALEEVWKAFDAEYPLFPLRREVDWAALRDAAAARMDGVKSTYEIGGIISDLIVPLRDLHAWVKVGDEWLPGYNRVRPLNGSWKGSEAVIGTLNATEHDCKWGRTRDDIGYVNVYELNDAAGPPAFDAALEQLADCWALVLDLRFNGGGDELLARQYAGRLLAEPVVYSLNQYRNGPAHDAYGPRLERSCDPRGPWRFESPVIVLQGQRTMSSAESFLLMLAQAPQVTTLGDRSAGSSANPRRLDVAGRITVNLPRWLDMLPDGTPLDEKGVPPDVAVDAPAKSMSDTSDGVLQAALDRLRKLPRAERQGGKRS
jgi:Peptidase family S41